MLLTPVWLKCVCIVLRDFMVTGIVKLDGSTSLELPTWELGLMEDILMQYGLVPHL